MCPANATFTIRECTFVFSLQSDLMAPLLMGDKKCASKLAQKLLLSLPGPMAKFPEVPFHRPCKYALRYTKSWNFPSARSNVKG